ncbi:hypothetical protein PQJ75_00645 [Rhodoplanes sp. TEM]|uniref:Uncharacterized protein n=1 Tax=Rhodoplanes tepidamans TaxID=200616 RepID=A0ABT5J6V2_RHOTP|nr:MULTISPECIES: hypothetical protein [Rhodoplanes]MDC7784760.1 hypothetical protein [Rhodoplanes tepidamans]MDC7982227.1 hypothetical protein [Rhodoplanes sp. TEM]MDQ0356234.1 hypothetical protein [Rhodoplanes tepidamans]
MALKQGGTTVIAGASIDWSKIKNVAPYLTDVTVDYSRMCGNFMAFQRTQSGSVVTFLGGLFTSQCNCDCNCQ